MEYSPHLNKDVIALVLQPDGNWVAEAFKHGRVIRVRGGNPVSVLQGVLTHDGKADLMTV